MSLLKNYTDGDYLKKGDKRVDIGPVRKPEGEAKIECNMNKIQKYIKEREGKFEEKFNDDYIIGICENASAEDELWGIKSHNTQTINGLIDIIISEVKEYHNEYCFALDCACSKIEDYLLECKKI